MEGISSRDAIIVGADENEEPAIFAELYGISLAESQEHHRAFREALNAGEDVELGAYVCKCSYCRRARNASVS